ncbi:MAG TPA: tetratricopeptide repeat protein [Candidatus Binatia bacterium]|nr:tetratricopeptide repeat protein [Candidatus Binatia bacterium]
MPQHAKRVRISRKSLRQPDEFQTIAGGAFTWAEQHVRELLTGVGVLVAIAVAAIAVGRYRASREAAAAYAFQSARAVLEAGKFKDAATAFADLRRDYGSTSFGRLAGLYAGHALARAGDLAGAATAYEEFLAGTPPADYLRQEALDSLGHVKEAGGDASGALDAYTRAGALDGPFRTDALLGAARLDEAAGKTAEAQELYRKLLAEASNGELQEFLRSKLPGDVPKRP